jgi:hypothetical protein
VNLNSELRIIILNFYFHSLIFLHGRLREHFSLWSPGFDPCTSKMYKTTKSYRTTRHEGVWEERSYSSHSFSTSSLDGGELLASRPGRALALGKGHPVPTVQEPGWASDLFWTQRLQEKFFCLCRGSNLDRPVVQPVTRHHTDCAT